MNCYLAPMEGITGYIYRNAHHDIFGGVDKYFSPFISPNQKKKFSSKEINDILPEHNQGIPLVPQILTNQAEDFIWAALEFKALGYEEVNLNLGCPSGTVVSKKKGAGFLAYPDRLDLFLEQVFSALDLRISIKTRIGKTDPDEFYELIEIYNKYPLEELIIHPRIQTDYYKNTPNMKVFQDGLKLGKAPICYNGDLFTADRAGQFSNHYPQVKTVMLGRGVIANPGLVIQLKENIAPDKERLKAFHDEVYEGYKKIMSGERNPLFRMKELWFYMGHMFTSPDKYMKKIKKAERFCDYDMAVSALFGEQEVKPEGGYQGVQ
ncbi:diguanylate cyclase [Clostridium sp. MCC353]|uniref:tRNA dihydrouridine synthase n=1 Tax=Clostridium sp. MCC353 TaxID=2592646 RepID=UPI001C02DF68|nr:tRNA-dihydrouridine synthase family protein [Clostridium sp. MCC353]MBT9779217.1 diguanylate cyclase [Clostridium sp. MCC353]